MAVYVKKALRGALWVFVMGLVASFLSYAIRVFLARKLSLEEFGLFFAVFTFITFISTFKDVGLRHASVKFIAEYCAKKQWRKLKGMLATSFGSQGLLLVVIAMLILVFAPFLTENYFRSPGAYPLLMLSALYLFASYLYMNIRSLLKGFQELAWFSLSDPIRIVITFFLLLVLFSTGLGVVSAMWAYALGGILVAVILVLPLKKYFFVLKEKLVFTKALKKNFYLFGLAMIFTEVGEKVIGYVDVLLLTYFATLETVGIYSVVLPSAVLLLLFGTSLANVVYPMVADLWAKKEYKRVRLGIRAIYAHLFLFITPVFLGVMYFADVLLRIFFGSEFVVGAAPFRVLLVGVLLYTLAKVSFSALAGRGMPAITTMIIGVAALLNLIVNLFLIPLYGMMGAAIATTASYTLAFVLSLVWLDKHVGVKAPWILWLSVVGLGLVFWFVLVLVDTNLSLFWLWQIVVSVGVACFVYLAAVFALRLTSLRELQALFKQVF